MVIPRFIRCAALLAALCLPLHAASVEATLEPDMVEEGSGAMLRVTVTGGSAQPFTLPEVPGLVVESRGTSRQFRFTNGRASNSMTYQFIVGAHKAGDYEIPSFDITVDGQRHATGKLTLKVVPGNAPSGGQPDQELDDSRFGFLTVTLVGEHLEHIYVGQIVPVIIKAWLPADSQVQLRSSLQPQGSGFTLHNVSDKPRQTRENRDGKPYTVVTWYAGISATQAGEFPASLAVEANVAIRDSSARRQPRARGGRFGNPFDDPFFDNFFAPMIQKDVTLKSQDQTLTILPLPALGRPANFTGAVGQFSFGQVKVPSSGHTGEPLSISAAVEGSGNFQLLAAPVPEPAAIWKSYPGKDEFKPKDMASFAGTKSFQFSAVPQKGGEQDLTLSFSYFDPETGAYQTLTTPQQRIQIAGKDIVAVRDVISEAPAIKEEKSGEDLVANHDRLHPVSTLVPLVDRPDFGRWLAASGGMVLFGGVLALVRRRRDDPRRRARAALAALTGAALNQARQAAAAGDVSGYYACARQALQEQLAARWDQPAGAITLNELEARLPADSPVTRFFREADGIVYQPVTGSATIPDSAHALLRQALAALDFTPAAS